MNENIVEYPSEWAQIDQEGNVVNVIVALREQILDRAGDGFLYIESVPERQALMHGRYHEDTDSFSPSAPFDSWSWNDDERSWIPPSPKPSKETWFHSLPNGDLSVERDVWMWDESSLSWIDARDLN